MSFIASMIENLIIQTILIIKILREKSSDEKSIYLYLYSTGICSLVTFTEILTKCNAYYRMPKIEISINKECQVITYS